MLRAWCWEPQKPGSQVQLSCDPGRETLPVIGLLFPHLAEIGDNSPYLRVICKFSDLILVVCLEKSKCLNSSSVCSPVTWG